MQAKQYIDEFIQEMQKVALDEIQAMEDAIYDAYVEGKHVFIIGNGGSAANASHLCEDLGKGTLSDFENQKRLKVMSLTDNTPYITAWGNDEGYDCVFTEQLKNFGEAGDLVLAISGSGNSPNVIKAIEWSKANGLKTFGITGYDGGKLKELADASWHVKHFNMGLVEAVHSVALHYLIDALKERFKNVA